MTAFDMVALAILGVSALIGFARGATREVVTLLAFVLAALIAVFGLRFSAPIARHMVHPSWAATPAALLVVFIVLYILFRILGGQLVQGVRNVQHLSTLDRMIGLGFGLIRGLVVLGVFNLAFNLATPPERMPKWVTGAALYPLSNFSAHALKALAPKGSAMANKLAPTIENAVRDGSDSSSADSGKREGYDNKARKGLDDLVEQTR